MFARFGSGVDEAELAVLLTIAPFATSQLSFATIVTVACAPFAREPRFAVTVEPPPQVPTLAAHETKVILAGRVSVTTTLLALFGPLLVTVIRYVTFVPAAAEPPETPPEIASVNCRSAAITLTASLQLLFCALLSAITPPGSAAQTPAARGLAKVPGVLGVAATCTTNDPGAPMITFPLAAHVSVLLLMPQLIVPGPEIFVRLETLAFP